MDTLAGLAYFIIGGVVTGQAIYMMHQNDAFETDRETGEEFPLVGFLLMAMTFWLAWPIVLGVTRADKLRKKLKD